MRSTNLLLLLLLLLVRFRTTRSNDQFNRAQK